MDEMTEKFSKTSVGSRSPNKGVPGMVQVEWENYLGEKRITYMIDLPSGVTPGECKVHIPPGQSGPRLRIEVEWTKPIVYSLRYPWDTVMSNIKAMNPDAIQFKRIEDYNNFKDAYAQHILSEMQMQKVSLWRLLCPLVVVAHCLLWPMMDCCC